MDEKTNRLANTFNSYLQKEFPGISVEKIWEVSSKMAIMANGRKSYAKMYNSPEGRMERKLNSKK